MEATRIRSPSLSSGTRLGIKRDEEFFNKVDVKKNDLSKKLLVIREDWQINMIDELKDWYKNLDVYYNWMDYYNDRYKQISCYVKSSKSNYNAKISLGKQGGSTAP